MWSDINPWGLTSIATALVALLFSYFLWRAATPSPVTRRFSFLLLIEVVTVLTSSAGIPLLMNFQVSEQTGMVLDILHHLGDVLMLILYPIFVAHALSLKKLKFITGVPARIAMWTFGLLVFVWVMLDHAGIITSGLNPDMLLYLVMCTMFMLIFIVSLAGLKAAKTKLTREKALAFILAFGIRDLSWFSVYLAAATGWIEGNEILFSQIYAGSTLLYIPIVAYGILKLQLLDIEVRLQSTIANTVLASAFVAVYYLVSEGVNNFISDQLGGMLGFVVCAVLAIFLAPLHRWADRFAERLINADSDSPDYAANRGLQIYSSAVEEALAYGDINAGQVALLERLRQSPRVSENDANRVERQLHFDRTALAG